jgi:hypothetical protein
MRALFRKKSEKMFLEKVTGFAVEMSGPFPDAALFL